MLASLSWGRFDPPAGLVTKINARDRWGRTALDLALVGGHKEVEVLLSAHEAIAVAREEEEPRDLLPAYEKPPRRGCPLLQMPTEVLVLILSWLEPPDLCAVAHTCWVTLHPRRRVHSRVMTRVVRRVWAGSGGSQPRQCIVAAVL